MRPKPHAIFYSKVEWMTASTPTSNHSLPLKTHGFTTLAEGLDYAAKGETGGDFYSSRGGLEVAVP